MEVGARSVPGAKGRDHTQFNCSAGSPRLAVRNCRDERWARSVDGVGLLTGGVRAAAASSSLERLATRDCRLS